EGTVAKNNGVHSARTKFFYADDDGLLVGMRDGDYKYVFCEQRLAGTMGVWAEPFTKLRMQKAFNLFQDPYERADITSNTYCDCVIDHVTPIYGAIADVGAFAATFKEFPPRSIPPSFSAYTIMEDTLKEIKAQQKLNELRGLPVEQGTQQRP